MSSRRQSLRLQQKNTKTDASPPLTSASRAVESITTHTAAPSPSSPTPSEISSTLASRNTYPHTDSQILDTNPDHVNPPSDIIEITSDASGPTANTTPPAIAQSMTRVPHSSTHTVASVKSDQKPSTDAPPPHTHHTDGASVHSNIADFAAQIERDMEEELKNLSSPSEPDNNFIEAADSLIDDSTPSRLLELENKIDVLIAVQRHCIKSQDTASSHLQSIETRLDAISQGIQSLFTSIQDTPNYNQHFSKLVDLFGHTLRSIQTLDTKISSHSNETQPSNLPSSGFSYESDSSNDAPRNVVNANLASISLPNLKSQQQPRKTAFQSFSSPNPSAYPPHDNTSINHSIIEILDKLVESKSSKSPTNVNFPSFSGLPNTMSFHKWATLVCTILATSEWKKLYDPHKQSYILDGSKHETLNNHLYSALILKLKGPASDYATSRRDLNGDGIGLLEALRHSFKSILTPADLANLEDKFRKVSRGKEESIESFVIRLETIQHEILDNGGYSTPQLLKRNFILGLGPEFSDIIRLLNTGTLPPEWKPLNLHTLLPVAKRYLQSVLTTRQRNREYKELHKSTTQTSSKSTGKPQTSTQPATNDAIKDRIKRIYTAIYHKRFKASDFEREVGPGCCVFHGTRDHKTNECLAIQKAMAKSELNHVAPVNTTHISKPPTQPVAKVASLSHQSIPESILSQIEAVDFSALQGDDDNNKHSSEDVSPYLSLTSRNIILASSNNNETTPAKLKLILDSGAFPHMCNNRFSFDNFYPWPPSAKVQDVLLADGTSRAPIRGIGSIIFSINSFIVRLHNVLYVPTLSTSLFSVKEHAQYDGCSLRIEHNRYFLSFPSYTIKKTIGDELSITVKLPCQPCDIIHFDSSSAPLSQHSSHSSHDSLFQNLVANRADFGPRHDEVIQTLGGQPSSDDHLPPDHISTSDPTPQTSKLPIIEEVPCDNNPTLSPNLEHSDAIEMFPDPHDTELANNGENISTFPPPYLSSNPRIHLKLPDSTAFQNGFLHKSLTKDHWNFYPGTSRKTKPNILHTNLLSNLFSAGLFRRGFLPTNSQHRASPSDLPHWLMHGKITIQLPEEIYFRRGFIVHDNGNITFAEGLKRGSIKNTFPLDIHTLSNLHSNLVLRGHNHRLTDHTSQSTSPRLRPVDTVLQSTPSTVQLTDNDLRQGFGFRNTATISRKLHSFTKKTFSLTVSDAPDILDLGNIATIDKSKRNTTPLTLPQNFGDLVHCDILYGSETSIKGFKYALYLIDKATRFKFVYGLKSLTDVLVVFKRFCADIGFVPKELRTDFDTKLMGSNMQQFMNHHGSVISSVPSGKQRANGICERSWRSLLRMSRSWLASSLLPTKFWFHALKRAAEVSNYLPLTLNDSLTTPFELVYKEKPDLRNLLPLFSVSYVRRSRDANTDRLTFHSTSLRCLCLGRDDVSNQLEFFHPLTRQLLYSDDYIFDKNLCPGPTFNLDYDGGLYLNKYKDYQDEDNISPFPPNYSMFAQSSTSPPSYTPCKIVRIPEKYGDTYTVSYPNGNIHQHPHWELFDYDPSDNSFPNAADKTLPSWIRHNCKATIFLPTMDQPKHGYLIDSNDKWLFQSGKGSTLKYIELLDFHAVARDMIKNFNLFEGHKRFRDILHLRSVVKLKAAVARHVSATGLSNLIPPTSLDQHAKMSPQDKDIWDAAYLEEINGLQEKHTWDTISEDEYNSIKHKVKALLPSMAISTIKYDENGRPKRAKYRIVALGNLDRFHWSKGDVYAPVLSMIELRLLTSIAVRNGCVMKSGDIKQAFIQASLPPDETYVVRPPKGCTQTHPLELWKLRKPLYGLRRAPRHWYDKFRDLLSSINLRPCQNAPCIFHGEILPDKPPLYVGVYVDDFVYFSTCPEVEKDFESRLSSLTDVDFMGDVSHFLGIKFSWHRTSTNLCAHLSQSAFIDNLAEELGLDKLSTKHPKTPYRSGLPIDSIPDETVSASTRDSLKLRMQQIMGSLQWLSHCTRPDIATATSILAQYQNTPSPGHLQSARYIVKYLKGTSSLGITFNSSHDNILQSFLQFPQHGKRTLAGISDGNWGAQDQSTSYKNDTLLALHKSWSISGHIITLHGPIHWSSKRQTITARSSAESEIYATDECCKDILYLSQLIHDLNLQSDLLSKTIHIYNDSMACVHWTRNKTTRSIRHIQLRENAIRESVQKGLISVLHVPGTTNPSDLLTKEDRDSAHYLKLRDCVVSPPPTGHVSGINNLQVHPSDPMGGITT